MKKKKRFVNHIKGKDLTMQFNGIHVHDSIYEVKQFSIIYAARAMIRIFVRMLGFHTKQQKSFKKFFSCASYFEKRPKNEPLNQYSNGKWRRTKCFICLLFEEEHKYNDLTRQ